MAAPTAASKTLSFTSSLNASEQNFMPKLPQTGPNHELLDYYQLFLGSKEEDGEIGVFQAEKYFNGEQDSPAGVVLGDNFYRKKHQEQEQDIVMELMSRPKLQQPCTPSIVSESSANSQSALLRKNPRNPNQRKPDRAHSCRGFLSAAICCKGSVGVHRNVGGALAPASSAEMVRSGPDPLMEQRLKLVDFRAQISEEQAKKMNKNSVRLGNRVAMLNSEFTARNKDIETESNASSDLFEIESLTGKVRSRQASDAAGGYAPSEVSIQWSVVTASAAGFSVASDFDDEGRRRGRGVKSDGDGGGGKRLGGGALLGCKSQKAVSVAGDALRSVSGKYGQVGEERRRGVASLAVRNPVARFQAETRLAGFDVNYGKQRASHLLYAGS